jgi:tRNA-specific 2-thiouridylase
MAKAIALLSGGLDSTLAVLLLLRQGIDVTAVTFLTHFGCDISDSSSCSGNPFPAAEKFGFGVKLCHLADKFIEVVKNPVHGRGRNMNPCIDCRILMLREARELMLMTGGDFIVTGEVVGQRPMSQRRDTLNIIDREAGLKGYVLRPLSAKLLPETAAEKEGLVKREMLCNFSGRSRKPQMALARDLGLTDYPAPAAGCLLTEPNYSYRLRELLKYNPDPSLNDLNLLRLGRHFRLSQSCKAIVGRDEKENETIESYAGEDNYLLRVEHTGSPSVLLSGQGSRDFLAFAASLCARYSDAKHLPEVEVTVCKGRNALRVTRDGSKEKNDESSRISSHEFKITVPPADRKLIEQYRIEKVRNIPVDERLSN